MKTDVKRIVWIDYLKAFACFLVAFGHLLQSFNKAGIDNYTGITQFINWFIYLFHMPLFMMISGFLYCNTKKRFTLKEYKNFSIKKIINLLIPYVTFYLLFIGINMLFSNSVNNARGIDDLLRIFNNPIAPYWFLYALMSIFIVIPILEKIFKNNKFEVLVILIVFKLLSVLFNTNIYFIDSIMAYGIYFYIGSFISKEDNSKSIMYNILLLILYFVISLIYYFVYDKVNIYINEYIRIVFALIGIYVFTNIFKKVSQSKILDSFKDYTFQIYLLHTIFAAGIRIVLLRLGINNYFIHFVLGIIFSIYVPVFISIISKKIRYTNFFFYPIKTVEELRGGLKWKIKN